MANQFSVKSRGSLFAQIFDETMNESAAPESKLPPELDFIQSPQGLGITFRPVQRVLCKAIFGTPMDYKQEKFKVWDALKERVIFEGNDCEYLKWVHEQDRCNFGDWRDLPPHGFYQTVLVAGRRAGKSALISGLVGGVLRNLLSVESPQDHYGLISGSKIDLTMMGTDEDSSDRLYEAVQLAVNRASYFKPFIKSSTGSNMTFLSPDDRRAVDALPSIKVAAYPCTTRAVRGPNNYVLALDEFAFFRSSEDTSSEQMYAAAIHSTSMFPSKEDQERPDSKVFMISSPDKKIGQLYELHALAMLEGNKSKTFTLRASSAEVNPLIPRDYLMEQYKKDPVKFDAELGGNFLDASGSYVPRVTFDLCVAKGRENRISFDENTLGRNYFWWIDYASKKDATGFAIGHLEMVEGFGVKLVYDYIDRMMVGEEFEGPGIPRSERVGMDVSEIDPKYVIQWLKYMHGVLPCFRGGTDQAGGSMLRYSLALEGIPNIDVIPMTVEKNSQLALALKSFMDRYAVEFPDVEKFTKEFNMLEARYVNKYKLQVAAPNEKGAHDDMADAAQGVAWLAKTWLDEDGRLAKDPSGSFLLQDQVFTRPSIITDPNGVSLREISMHGRAARADMSGVPPEFMMAVMEAQRGRKRY